MARRYTEVKHDGMLWRWRNGILYRNEGEPFDPWMAVDRQNLDDDMLEAQVNAVMTLIHEQRRK